MSMEKFSNNRAVRAALAIGFALPMTGDIPSAHANVEAQHIVPESVIEQTAQLYAETWQPNDGTPIGENFAEKQAVAQELGLTVYDYKTEFQDLRENAKSENSDSIPMSEYLDRAEEFFGRYGVEIITAESKNADKVLLIEEGTIILSRDQLVEDNSQAVKQALMNYIDSIGTQPVELIQEMGLKQVVLANLPGGIVEKSGNDASGVADSSHPELGTVFVDPSQESRGVLTHEGGHIWLANLLGADAMHDDEQYAALNPAADLYGNPRGYAPLFGEGSARYIPGNLLKAIEDAKTDEDKHKAEAAYAQYERSIVVTRNYAFTNVAEDEATMIEQLFSDYSRNIIDDPDSPVLREKGLLLMSYLATGSHPELVEYFARTSFVDKDAVNPLDPANVPMKFLNSPNTAK